MQIVSFAILIMNWNHCCSSST